MPYLLIRKNPQSGIVQEAVRVAEVTGVFVPAGARGNSLWREAGMPMKKYKPEQIVTLLRQIEVEIANGKTTPQACRDAQITTHSWMRVVTAHLENGCQCLINAR
jgi:hypothetical protein